MKIVLLSLSIAILGYFALQSLPLRDHNPRLASNSSEPTSDASTPLPQVHRARGHH